MFILLNGSFGIGKTTAANALVREVPGTAIYDPERVGFVLRRLPSWLLGRSTPPDDCQDLAQWRYLTAWGCRLKHRTAEHIIVPMTFTNRDYLETLSTTLANTAAVWKICLVAPLEVVEARLEERARREGTEVSAWALRRSQECVEAHRDPAFGVRVDATKVPSDVVVQIRQAVGI